MKKNHSELRLNNVFGSNFQGSVQNFGSLEHKKSTWCRVTFMHKIEDDLKLSNYVYSLNGSQSRNSSAILQNIIKSFSMNKKLLIQHSSTHENKIHTSLAASESVVSAPASSIPASCSVGCIQ